VLELLENLTQSLPVLARLLHFVKSFAYQAFYSI